MRAEWTKSEWKKSYLNNVHMSQVIKLSGLIIRNTYRLSFMLRTWKPSFALNNNDLSKSLHECVDAQTIWASSYNAVKNYGPLERNCRPHLIVLSVFHRPTDQLSFWIQSGLKSSGHSAISFQQLQPQSIVAEKFEAVDDGGHHSDVVVVVTCVVYVGIVGCVGRVFTRRFTQLILLTFTAHLGTSSVRISYAVASLASFGSLRAILRS